MEPNKPENIINNDEQEYSQNPITSNNQTHLESTNEVNSDSSINIPNDSESLLSQINNNIFLSESTLETLYSILFAKGSYLDEVSLKEDNINIKFASFLKQRQQSLLVFLGDKMQFYNSKLIDGELSHLEKLMKILRSKKRELRIKRNEIEAPQEIVEEEKNEEPENQYLKISLFENEFNKNHRSKTCAERIPIKNAFRRTLSCFNFKTEETHDTAQKKNVNNFARNVHNFLNFNDLTELISLNIFKKKTLKEYNPVENSFSFNLNDRYIVTLKSFEDKPIDKTSFFQNIPYSVLQNYIFPCFSAYNLFYLRQVSSEWRELIRSMWHKTFQREMHEQLYAADLCQEIEFHFKLIALRTPFVHKFAIFLKALAEILDWNWVHTLSMTANEEIDQRVKMIFYGLFKILGKQIKPLNNLNDMNDEIWEFIKPALNDGSLRNDMNDVIDSEYFFDSNDELMKMKEKIINCYSISMVNLGDLPDKNNIFILNIYLKQLFLFAMLKNSVFIGQKFLFYVKDTLKMISEAWPQKKGFLEGAYKILLFKNVKFIGGEIMVVDEDEFDTTNGFEENKENDDSNQNFLSLLNKFKDPSVPDFTIKKKGVETHIYLDDATKAELILSSILSFRHRSLGNLMHLASKTRERIEMINEELRREETLREGKKELERKLENENDFFRNFDEKDDKL